jgi:predicted alpha/beta superfamily hydrolase
MLTAAMSFFTGGLAADRAEAAAPDRDSSVTGTSGASQATQDSALQTNVTKSGTAVIKSIHSTILDENRKYWVYVPRNYYSPENKDMRYPLLVHLDGQMNAFWLPSVVEYMIGTKRIPAIIVVGVYTMDKDEGLTTVERTRDMTPTHSLFNYNGKDNQSYRKSGQSATFLRFLEEELLPVVDAEYRTRPQRAIQGLSLAGCFALNLYLTGTSKFQAFVALDPCLWWDRFYPTRVRDSVQEGSAILDRVLYLGISGTSSPNGNLQRKWLSVLEKKADPRQKRHLAFGHYPKDSHGSMHLPGFYDGVRFIFGKDCGLEW